MARWAKGRSALSLSCKRRCEHISKRVSLTQLTEEEGEVATIGSRQNGRAQSHCEWQNPRRSMFESVQLIRVALASHPPSSKWVFRQPVQVGQGHSPWLLRGISVASSFNITREESLCLQKSTRKDDDGSFGYGPQIQCQMTRMDVRLWSRDSAIGVSLSGNDPCGPWKAS